MTMIRGKEKKLLTKPAPMPLRAAHMKSPTGKTAVRSHRLSDVCHSAAKLTLYNGSLNRPIKHDIINGWFVRKTNGTKTFMSKEKLPTFVTRRYEVCSL
jgi:hypothetical protein